MKLVIAGASGFVGTELVRQSLRRSDISTIVALARKPVTVPEDIGSDADPSKLHSVVIDDYGTFPENVRKELAQADACIWYGIAHLFAVYLHARCACAETSKTLNEGPRRSSPVLHHALHHPTLCSVDL